MNTKKKNTPPKDEEPAQESIQSTRETIESVIVAFILAFLFRAFVAEAFVIPTGSMAPTLMGAHKDIYCEHCGARYQASASSEYDSNSGILTPVATIGSTCSVCRGLNAYDFRGNANHATFSGDRILVSKFDYVLTNPKRWDVFVFKYPNSARMNYIKRLVGLRGETLLLSEGDVYVADKSDPNFKIARKPPHKIQSMKQIVSDTNHQPSILREQGWPSLWQPWSGESGEASKWKVANSDQGWSAELAANSQVDWLRYYHKTVSEQNWKLLRQGSKIPQVDPFSSQLVTDYLAYNSEFQIRASAVMEPRVNWMVFLTRLTGLRRGPLNNDFAYWHPKPEVPADQTVFDYVARNSPGSLQENTDNGKHWVSDLTSKFKVDVQSDSGTLLLEIVEFGIRYQCVIDVSSGQATLRAFDGQKQLGLFAGQQEVSAKTRLRGRGNYRIEISNFDDQIVLWVNGSPVAFPNDGAFDSREFRTGGQRRPQWTATHPLDAAPIAIGGKDIAMKVERAEVYRDIYYIPIQEYNNYSDYKASGYELAQLYANPQQWESAKVFENRNTRTFELADDHYFPMGDNSAQSSDARAWTGHNYVEERFLLGKALLVFWPHGWNRPIPFFPNFSRIGLIR